jgi:hypothetical protein
MATFILTAEDTAPKSTSVSGTVSSFGTSRVITGSGTSFLSEVNGGDYIVNLTTNELRQVDFIISDTEIILKTAFATPFTGATVRATKGDSLEISVGAAGGDIPIIDKFDNVSSIVDGSSLTPRPDYRDAVSPFIIQATTAATAYCTTTP